MSVSEDDSDNEGESVVDREDDVDSEEDSVNE